MPQNNATIQNLDLLRPEVVRNQMIDSVDQMDYIELGNQNQYASAMSVFPTVNLDDPTESYYTYDSVTDAMEPVGFDAEAPLMSIDLPDQGDISVEGYKEAFNPRKGVETHASGLPFSPFQRGISKLNVKIWLTRELITWRGDGAVEGLIGPYGDTPHSDLLTDNVRPASTAWSDADLATPSEDIEDLSFDIVTNGMLSNGNVKPSIFMGPRALKDLKRTQDMEDKLPDNRYQQVNQQALNDILSEDIDNIYSVMVYYPRTNADGQFLDEAGNIVEKAKDAAKDNILEPYDPVADTIRRNVVVGRPGAGSAFIPWFNDRLTEDVGPGEVNGNMSVDGQNGFLTYVYKDNPTRNTYVSAEQEIGFELMRPENWGLITGV